MANVVPEVEIEQRLPVALSGKDYETAKSILDRAAFYGRDSSTWRASLANHLVKTQDPWSAIPQYRRSLKFYPQAAGYAQLGNLVEKLEGVEEAIGTWGEGLGHFPDDFDLNLRIAAGLVKTQRLDEAIFHLERAVELRPDDDAANRALADARARLEHSRLRTDRGHSPS